MDKSVLVVGAGLAGSEAAYYLAEHGVKVILVESKEIERNEAQKSSNLAELVCTNSLKSVQNESPHGLLKLEMSDLDSLIIKSAYETKVPAGEALAVDREKFSLQITSVLKNHPNIKFYSRVVSNPLELKAEFRADFVIVASGPLTAKPLSDWIATEISGDNFYFYDAIAPVVDGDSLDLSKLYFKDRHKEGSEGADYLNAPMNKEEYEAFIEALRCAEFVSPKDFEKEIFFESCLPIDVMARRGKDTARFSCMKPIGLETEAGPRPYAVVQLRKENLLGNAFNLVGFQTRLKYPEQERIFRMIPGFEKAEFLHLGSVHRNSFLHAKNILNLDMSSKKYPEIYFAGQMTGVEGYTESAASGLYVAFQLLRKIRGLLVNPFPVESAIGALINYLMTAPRAVPSNINLGLFPEVFYDRKIHKTKDKKTHKKSENFNRARAAFARYLEENR